MNTRSFQSGGSDLTLDQVVDFLALLPDDALEELHQLLRLEAQAERLRSSLLTRRRRMNLRLVAIQ